MTQLKSYITCSPIRSDLTRSEIANCLVEIEKEGFNLKEGISDYWNSRGVCMLLPNKNWILATLNDLSPFFGMSSIGPIRQPNNYPYSYNFSILNDSHTGGQFHYTPETIGKLLPSPNRVHKCVKAKAEIWLYDDEKLDMAVKFAFERFLFSKNLWNTYHVDGKMLPGNTGDIVGLTRSANSLKHPLGFLSFGPYIHLKKGKYEISIKYSTTGPKESIVGYVDMGQFNSPKENLLYKKSLQVNTEESLTTFLDVPEKGFLNFEVRIWFSGNGGIVIKSLNISRII